MYVKKATKSLWRYVLIKEVDRIADRSLEPTLIYFIEKVFPEEMTKSQILEEAKKLELKWTETHKGLDFYFFRNLVRIDLNKRRKNVWDIHKIGFVEKANGKGLKTYTILSSPDIYENEAIAHAFGKKYWNDKEELYPLAGITLDLFTNVPYNKKSEKILVREEKRKEEKLILKPSQKIPAYNGNKSFLFVSYSHKDSSLVYPEIEWLNREGFNIWYDEGIPPASEWTKVIPGKIVDSNIMILFISENSVLSNYVSKELTYAINHNKNILPIFLEETKLPQNFEFNLVDIQYIMKHKMTEINYKKKVLETLKIL